MQVLVDLVLSGAFPVVAMCAVCVVFCVLSNVLLLDIFEVDFNYYF